MQVHNAASTCLSDVYSWCFQCRLRILGGLTMEVAVVSRPRQDCGCVQGGGLAVVGRQKEVLGQRVCMHDCPSGGIGKGRFVAVLFVCAASIKLRQIVNERGLAR